MVDQTNVQKPLGYWPWGGILQNVSPETCNICTALH